MTAHSLAYSPDICVLRRADYETLFYLNRYRYLSAVQLCKLLSKEGKPLGTLSTQQARLKALWQAEYIQREAIPTFTHEGRGGYAYSLHTKGRNVVATLGASIVGRFRPAENRTHGVLFLPHSLGINDVLIGAELLARERADQVRIEDFYHERELRRQVRVRLPDGATTRTMYVEPDAWLDIVLPTQQERRPLLIEYDNDTERRKAWRQKIHGLLALVALDGQGTSPYQTFFGRTAFSFMVVTTGNDHKLRSLQQWTGEEVRAQGSEQIAPRFFFTNQSAATSSPAEFFGGRHWLSPFQEEPTALLPVLEEYDTR